MRFLTTILSFILLATLMPSVNAEESYFEGSGVTPYCLSIRTNVYSGSFTWTNVYPYPIKIKTMAFRFDSATATNAFTMTHYCLLESIAWSSKITTNNGGLVQTNAHASKVVTSTYLTNTICSLNTTNAQEVIISTAEDIPDDFYFMGRDIMTCTWTGLSGSSTTNVQIKIFGTR